MTDIIEKLKYPEHYYIDDDFFDDRDTEIRVRTKKIVKTRKEHHCALGRLLTGKEYHKIATGSLAVYEKAIVDGEWGSWYACIDCYNECLDEIYNQEDCNG
jgi:hypothetical protein